MGASGALPRVPKGHAHNTHSWCSVFRIFRRRTSAKKVEVFARSYGEVLAALNHQDEKLNRSLTALAFLTIAGISLYVGLERGPTPRQPVFLSEGGPQVASVLFVVFLASVAIALTTALAAIGPGTPLRVRSAPHSPDGSQGETSLLYYPSISAAPDNEWRGRYDLCDDALTELLGRHLHKEARVLSNRVSYKVARSRESAAFVHLAVASLVLLGVFDARGLSLGARWWIAGAFLAVMLLLPFWELYPMRRHRFGMPSSYVGYGLLAFSVIAALGFLVAGRLLDHQWEALYYALLVLLTSRLAAISAEVAQVVLPLAACAAVVTLVVMALS